MPAQAIDDTTGFPSIHDPWVLVACRGQVRCEPLSRTFIKASISFPGRLRWLPPELERILTPDGESALPNELGQAQSASLAMLERMSL